MKLRAIATAVFTLACGCAIAQTGSSSSSSTMSSTPAATANTSASANANAPAARPAATTSAAPSANMSARDARRERNAAFNSEKARIEKLLQGANEREEYIRVLENNGYRVTAAHTGGPNYLEYEVVKGGQSYEVQLDFDAGAPKASKIDVTPNQWRADATNKALSDPNYRPASPLAMDTEGRYSDRRYMKGWSEEKQKLEQALPAGLKAEDYKERIERMHYKIASVDDRDPGYLEYQIVKGDNSYDVQIEMDRDSKLAKSVEITSDDQGATPGGKADMRTTQPPSTTPQPQRRP